MTAVDVFEQSELRVRVALLAAGVDPDARASLCEFEDSHTDEWCDEKATRRFENLDHGATVQVCDEHYPVPEHEWRRAR